MTTPLPASTDVLVVGAGPAGSAAAAWLARQGVDVLLTDAATFPRDKTCGDGLTPRATAELIGLGLEDWLRAHPVNRGLRAYGFGQTLELRWPGGSLPDWGSAVPRTELDDHLRAVAIKSGATAVDGLRALGVRMEGERVAAVVFRAPTGSTGSAGSSDERGGTVEVACRRLVVADGVRSPIGKALGREWHRDTVYGVAGRSYVGSGRSDDPWISSHLELRDQTGAALVGYGWIFPLGTTDGANGEVNLGAGTLATARRPAQVAIKPLMRHYADQCREPFELHGELRDQASALLPMGGAVTGVAGANWALIGDAAGCVNPLNGEGIDYGLETGRLVAETMVSTGPTGHLATAWPALLRSHYGEAFSIARRLAGIATLPRLVPALGPAGMRSNALMTLALRWMGNLVTDDDRDRAARLWRWAGRRSIALDHRPPFT
ncbi:geranylgeranyl reductase family protein [Nocardioides sp. KR10-350]|uniref:geranylgeranyl reductase family protein n=1 Tax=Nocardioides cheoyonin TaxID=3156615 RepID=UPI0032B3DA49